MPSSLALARHTVPCTGPCGPPSACPTPTGPQLGATEPRLDLDWTSRGPRLDLDGASTRAPLDLDWTSTGPLLDLDGTSIGPLLDLNWPSNGSRLDLYWISTGPPLDLYWISTGHILDLDWTDTRPRAQQPHGTDPRQAGGTHPRNPPTEPTHARLDFDQRAPRYGSVLLLRATLRQQPARSEPSGSSNATRAPMRITC